jgi:outer membrane protein assembly factor BamB
VDPLNSPALEQLMRELEEDPQNETLKNQIRAVDLLARKAYFTSQWQIKIGGYLLFGGLVILVIGLKMMSDMNKKFPEPEKKSKLENIWQENVKARQWIGTVGLGLVTISIILIFLSHSELSHLESGKADKGGGITIDAMKKNWPSFRGPGGNGISYQTNFPIEWDGNSELNILWKTPIPKPGFNSPIVWNDRVFLSGADESVQQVYCFDVESGELLWQKDIVNIPGSPVEPPNVTDDTGYAAPTVTTDGRRVYALFATGDMVCLDFEGNVIWGKNLGVPDNHYGHSSSLLMYKDLVLVQYDHGEGGHLLGVHALSGTVRWNTNRDVEISWASPILVNTGDRVETILNANPFVASYDAVTGQELWKIDCMGGEVAPSPAFSDGMVFAVNEYARLAAIQMGAQAQIVWEVEEYLSEVSSPVAKDQLLFLATSYGEILCYDAKKGTRYWMEEFDEGFYSSPIIAEDRVYLIDMKGTTHIFKAAQEYIPVAKCELGESSVCTPAFLNEKIYIRGDEHLFCIGK